MGTEMAKAKPGAFEQELLQDKDVRFGFDNYDVLQQIGQFVREMRAAEGVSQSALQALSGISQADISRLESGAMERGPSLLTLVRLAHATGKKLVISLHDEQSDQAPTQVLSL